MRSVDDLEKRTVVLGKPVEISGEMVSKLVLREPVALDLKGVKMLDLLQLDTAAHAILIPRICVEPSMTPEDFGMFSGSSLVEVMSEAVNFFAESGVSPTT